MKTHRFFGIASIFLSLQLTALYVNAPAIMPVVAYAKVSGAKQGRFNGSATAPGFEGQVALVNVEYDEAAGKKSKLIVEKYPDASSNQFQAALLKNEILSRDDINMIKFEKGIPKTYQTYTLTGATVSSIDFENNVEKITFKFEAINIQVIN